jgi:Amt family ammonium transporter
MSVRTPTARTLFVFLAVAMLLMGIVAIAHAQDAGTPPPPPPSADPGGDQTGAKADITAKDAAHPTPDELLDQIGHNKIAINFVWVLMAGFLVFFMQAGFAMLEVGFVRAKNAVHTMMMNLIVYGLGIIGFFLTGFALMFGNAGPIASLGGGSGLCHEFTLSLFGKDFGFFGLTGFGLSGMAYDCAVFGLFMFQVVFMDCTATIPTGAMAERWRFKAFILWGLAASMIYYPLFGNWVWGGGWLSKLGSNFGLGNGYIDFAGSTVVHAMGGIAAFVGAAMLGPRIGKFAADKKPRAIPGHDIPIAMLGALILGFGWFGFNAGSTLAGGDVRLAVVAVNTALASCAGMLSAMAYMKRVHGKFDAPMSTNGYLAGLVAITAPCAFVPAWAAVVIGLVAGVLVCVTVIFVDNVLHVDDPVGAVAVHGACGLWGGLSLGIFADGTYGKGFNGVDHTVRGLLFGGAGQFAAQCIGVLTCLVYAAAASFVIFKVIGAITPMRSKPEDEEMGLDMPETGVLAYPDFQTVQN